MIGTIVIVGGGQAGTQAVDTLRREGFVGRLVLVSDEHELPYQRPPLSKKYLSGDMPADRLLFRHRAFYEQHNVELMLGAGAIRVDRSARSVALSNGEAVAYDRLLLCVGFALFISMTSLTGCGGSSGGAKTAAGTYTFNVVATSGSATSTATYKLTVE